MRRRLCSLSGCWAGGIRALIHTPAPSLPLLRPLSLPIRTHTHALSRSSDSTEGACADPGRDYSCTAANTCRTCSTFAERGGFCSEVDYFPNASVADYGRLIGEAAMRAEIFARGPISCSLNAQPLHSYQGGIFDDDDAEKHTNHLVSIVGWGVEPAGDDGAEGRPYWIGRNRCGGTDGGEGYGARRCFFWRHRSALLPA